MSVAHPAHRLEHDLLGDREIPQEVYWGVHTLRALENFPISGQPISRYPELIQALAMVKQAAALANRDLGDLDQELAEAIVLACQEIIQGALHDQFVVDVIQGGAGTSSNMNANEVICNRALELMGRVRGDYAALHPNNHVNMAQSTNDVYPSALCVATGLMAHDLEDALQELQQAFAAKADEFKDILKLGRTQLQDAVPMTLGQEFRTYALMVEEDLPLLREAVRLLGHINLGATAIGTGINCDSRYSTMAIEHLARLSGLALVPAANLIEATQDTSGFVHVSGILKRIASKLSKICNDLRLLSSGPQTGLGEFQLPERAAGSSIMPGKVNPIIPEVMNQIAFEVIGNDVTITMASEAGQLQLNAFEPIIAHSLYKSMRHLAAGCRTLARNCVSGIVPNRELLGERVRRAATLATALNPYVGYENATRVARAAQHTGRPVAELVLEMGLLDQATLDEALCLEALTAPRVRKA